jgi:hypothetical protein
LWCNPTKVSQQAVSQRFLTFPSELFEKVFKDLLPGECQFSLLRSNSYSLADTTLRYQ